MRRLKIKEERIKRMGKVWLVLLMGLFCSWHPLAGQVATLRTAFYVFLNQDGAENFHPDSTGHRQFLSSVTDWVNHKLEHLDTLRPAMPSPFVGDALVRLRVDTVFFISDQQAWDASVDVAGPYIRETYVDGNNKLDYRGKYQTLPVFIAGNHKVAGGHAMGIGSKWYIAVRGYYHQYRSLPQAQAVEECAKNLIHELGHCLGLMHNFQGGPNGEQCDFCEDNGCPLEGTSNNIMDYWPNFGHALSECQFQIIQSHLRGERGDISEVVINDSCFHLPGWELTVPAGGSLLIADTIYAHGDCIVGEGAHLRITGYLSMPIGSKLVMGQGARLEVDGGFVGNLCGEMWEGVRIGPYPAGPQTEVSLTGGGGLIHAQSALLVSGRASLKLEDARFINCVNGIVAEEDAVNELFVDRCHFLVTDKLNQYEEGVVPNRFIDFTGGYRVTVQDSRFVNVKGTLIFDADNTGIGLAINQSSLTVRNSDFVNLFRAVWIAGNQPWQQIRLAGNRFTHNRCALHAFSQGVMVLDSNNFRMQRFNDRTTYGIVLEQPDRLVISDNQFTSQFGGGSMAAILLSRPAARSALVTRNRFENLPSGIVVDQPPVVDEILLDLAVNRQFVFDELLAGPQFPNNQFNETTLPLLMMNGATGSVIGWQAEGPLREANPLDWPVGGFALQNPALPIGAVERSGSVGSKREHGLYVFMNHLNFDADLNAPQPNGEAVRVVGDYLREFERILKEVLPGDGLELFALLRQLESVPAVLRSGYLAPFGTLLPHDAWLPDLLSGMAGTFCRADTLLAAIAVDQAKRNAENWIAGAVSVPEAGRPIQKAGLVSLPELTNLPVFYPFRFAAIPPGSAGIPAFRLWPVPAVDYVYIHPLGGHKPGREWRWHLIDGAGLLVRQGRIEGWDNLRIPVGDLLPGVYHIRLADGATGLGSRSFVKIRIN